MIIGNGLLAKAFSKYIEYEDIVIFASGVSNSNEIEQKNYNREKILLCDTIAQNPNKLLVYFSSCDVEYADIVVKQYYFHKIQMEQIVRNLPRFYVFRLPQIIGKSSNKYSLINFFIQSIQDDREIVVFKNAYKNILGIQEAFLMIDHIISNKILINNVINVLNSKYYSVKEIISVLEKLMNKKARLTYKDCGYKPEYKKSNIEGLQLDFADDYLERSLLLNDVCENARYICTAL